MNTHVFNNGLKFIHQSVGHSGNITSIYVYIRFGSIHETEEFEKGIAHFIEHMCFKGTHKFKSSMDIMKIYDGIGAYFNAETDKQHTCYKIRCLDENVEKSIQVLSDILFNSVFKKKEIDLERNVVLEENIRAQDDPITFIENAIYKILYANTPFSDPVDDVSYHSNTPIIRKDILRLYDTFYRPSNMGISIVSNLSFLSLKKMIMKSRFMVDNPRTKPTNSLFFSNGTSSQTMNYELIHRPGMSATSLSITFKTCKHLDPESYPLYVLSYILGGYMSSRLFTILREKWGLTYMSDCNSTNNLMSGHFEVYTMCDPKSVMKNSKNPGVLLVVLDIIKDILKNGITQKELTIAKGHLKGKMALSVEHSHNKCMYNGLEYIIYDSSDIEPYESFYDKYYKPVTKGDIDRAIRRYFQPHNMLVCLVGEHLPSLDAVQKNCHYLFN